jgi:carboxymethylenebutenolidase
MHFLKQRADFLGRTGFLGLSVGGHIGYLAATQLDLAACVIFYAGWLTNTDIELSQPAPTLTLTPGIARNGGRILFFVGGKDALVTVQQREEIARALEAANVRHEMIVYPEAQHGFFCDERDTFDAVSSKDAWERTIKLFESELRG